MKGLEGLEELNGIAVEKDVVREEASREERSSS